MKTLVVGDTIVVATLPEIDPRTDVDTAGSVVADVIMSPTVLASTTVVVTTTVVDTATVVAADRFADVAAGSLDGAVATRAPPAHPPTNNTAAKNMSEGRCTCFTIVAGSCRNQRLMLRPEMIPPRLVPLSAMCWRRGPWVSTLLLGVLLIGCGGTPETFSAEDGFILSQDYQLPVVDGDEPQLPTVTRGADDIEVRVKDVSRIIVLNQAIAETVVSLGLERNIIGRDATTTLASLVKLPKVSNGHDIGTESVLSLRPTLVIGDTRTGPAETVVQLRAAGVPILIVPEVWTLSELPSRVRMIAGALGVPDTGERLVALSERSIDEALRGLTPSSRIPRVAFLYVRGTASVYLLGGSGSGADEIIAAAGGIDVGAAAGLASFTPLTAEAIVQADPDIILVMSKGVESVGGVDGLVALPGVSSTRAAGNRAVIAVDDDLLLSFGPRTGALIARLAELFTMLSPTT